MLAGQGNSNQWDTATPWSVVARAAGVGVEVKRQALEQLIRRYQPVLQAHLMHRFRMSSDAADDMLQAFLLSKVLEAGIINRADRQRGRFRSFLISALERFTVNQIRDQRALKRGGGQVESLDSAANNLAARAGDERQDAALVARWGQQVVRRAVELTRTRCFSNGRADIWNVFEARVLLPATCGEQIEYSDLVRQFGFASPREASNVLITAKRTFVSCLRTVVGEYAEGDEEIDAEIAELRAVLALRCET